MMNQKCKNTNAELKKVTVVGAGPSGLFASYLLLEAGYSVDLFDHSSGAGKKFLVAGNGGLNLTHSEGITDFSKKYSENERLFEDLIRVFGNDSLRDFCHKLGVETFIGSSGRVFPVKLNAADMLRSWLSVLRSYSKFSLHLNMSLTDLVYVDGEFNLGFINKKNDEKTYLCSATVILALGGASWKKTGSDGSWAELLKSFGIKVVPFYAMNCGYEVRWSEYFSSRITYQPLKNISINGKIGEIMLTPSSIEGGLVYTFSKYIQRELRINRKCYLQLDLRPNHTEGVLLAKLKKKKSGDSRSNQLRKCLKISKIESLLIHELLEKEIINDDEKVVSSIKSLKVNLIKERPIDEAISTSGGVCFSELSDVFESQKFPGLFFAGEMMDWDAPTGGYLLQGCFSTAYHVVQQIIK